MDGKTNALQNEPVESEKKKSDWLMRVCLTQVIVCAALFGVLMLCLKLGGNPSFGDRINEILSISLTRQQISEAYYRVKEFVSAPAGGWLVSLPEGQDEKQTQQSTAQQEQSEAQQETKAAVSQLGVGGEDIGASQARAQAVFSPYLLTALPVRPADGGISSAFGSRVNPKTGEEAFHSGIDIAAKEDSAVRAAFYGRVLRTGESEISGKFVIMSHSDGLETRYYHCNKILVEPGAVIRQGETIALVGSTGRSTGPHLHFEIRINGIRVNPSYALGAVYER